MFKQWLQYLEHDDHFNHIKFINDLIQSKTETLLQFYQQQQQQNLKFKKFATISNLLGLGGQEEYQKSAIEKEEEEEEERTLKFIIHIKDLSNIFIINSKDIKIYLLIEFKSLLKKNEILKRYEMEISPLNNQKIEVIYPYTTIYDLITTSLHLSIYEILDFSILNQYMTANNELIDQSSSQLANTFIISNLVQYLIQYPSNQFILSIYKSNLQVKPFYHHRRRRCGY